MEWPSMKGSSTVPEYSVEEWQEILPTGNGLRRSSIRSLVEVEAELALLSKELTMSVDILGKIRDSVRVLEQSLGEQQ